MTNPVPASNGNKPAFLFPRLSPYFNPSSIQPHDDPPPVVKRNKTPVLVVVVLIVDEIWKTQTRVCRFLCTCSRQELSRNENMELCTSFDGPAFRSYVVDLGLVEFPYGNRPGRSWSYTVHSRSQFRCSRHKEFPCRYQSLTWRSKTKKTLTLETCNFTDK